MAFREDSFELAVPKRMASSDAGSALACFADAQAASEYPSFRQGDIVRIPPGRYYVTQRSKTSAHTTMKLKVHARGRVVSIAASRSQRQQAEQPFLDPREFISTEQCMCYRLPPEQLQCLLRILLNSAEYPGVDFVFVPEAKLKPWRDCICLAYATQPCPRCHQVYYCSQHCQQKHWDAQHKHTCNRPRATLRPLGCHPLPRKAPLSARSDPGPNRENIDSCNPLAHVGRSMRVAPHSVSEIVPEEDPAEEPLFTVHSTGDQFRQLPSEQVPRHSKWKFWKRS